MELGVVQLFDGRSVARSKEDAFAMRLQLVEVGKAMEPDSERGLCERGGDLLTGDVTAHTLLEHERAVAEPAPRLDLLAGLVEARFTKRLDTIERDLEQLFGADGGRAIDEKPAAEFPRATGDDELGLGGGALGRQLTAPSFGEDDNAFARAPTLRHAIGKRGENREPQAIRLGLEASFGTRAGSERAAELSRGLLRDPRGAWVEPKIAKRSIPKALRLSLLEPGRSGEKVAAKLGRVVAAALPPAPPALRYPSLGQDRGEERPPRSCTATRRLDGQP